MRPRMLLVEDCPGARAAMGAYFKASGFDVWEAPDRDSAMRILATAELDVVLTDLRLADGFNLAGLEVVRAARSRFPRAIVVLQSSHLTSMLRASAVDAGADLAMQKPEELKTSVQMIRLLLERCR